MCLTISFFIIMAGSLIVSSFELEIIVIKSDIGCRLKPIVTISLFAVPIIGHGQTVRVGFSMSSMILS
jgi:hypothetical protein